MNAELETLEAKIEQVVALVHQLRAENEVLRNQMIAAEAERLHLRQGRAKNHQIGFGNSCEQIRGGKICRNRMVFWGGQCPQFQDVKIRYRFPDLQYAGIGAVFP